MSELLAPLLSVIVPTMNEAGNIHTLLNRLGKALGSLPFELIFVDDSTDNTPQVIELARDQAQFTIRLIVRPSNRRNGLSGAVVEGFAAARGEWVCVMDGDLQHPPEVVPQMLVQAQTAGADMVVGSRKANLLGPMGLSQFRSFTSQILTILARALFPRSLKDVSDPLTGLFLVRRNKLILERLQPDGFKILLEILVRCPHMRITEVKFDFATRHDGESKADFQEGLRYFRHLWRLRLHMHQRPLALFLLVGLLAFFINTSLLFIGVELFALPSLLAAFIALECASLWSYWGREKLAFADEETVPVNWRVFFIRHQLFSLLLTLPLMALLEFGLSWSYLWANFSAIALTTFLRYMLSDRWIWTQGLLIGPAAGQMYYLIHGRLLIASPMRLPDLDRFWVAEPPPHQKIQLQIRLDRHGTPRQLAGGISFDEHLGRLGFALTVLPGRDFSEIVVSPLVEHTPHLLYTHVLEPLLRWILPQHGLALVPAGCLLVNGRGRLVTAPLREQRQAAVWHTAKTATGSYVSHELVIVNAQGEILPFPKPLTHRRVLEKPAVRQLGAWLRRLSLPTVTLNAYLQRLMPPRQKWMRDMLPNGRKQLPAAVAHELWVVQEGGEARELSPVEGMDYLLNHAQDAYGFPLFTRLEAELRPVQALEREIVTQALKNCSGRVVPYDPAWQNSLQTIWQ